MSLPAKKTRVYPEITDLRVGADSITAILSDGREVSIPIAWFPRLSGASREQLDKFDISPAGYGINWPLIDEDISIKAFLD